MASILKTPQVIRHSAYKDGQYIPITYGRQFNPDIYRIEFDDERSPLVIKTFSGKHPLVQMSIGRFITRREHKMMIRLRDIDGICRIKNSDCSEGIIMEWIDGKKLNEIEEGSLPEEFFEQLKHLVKSMHNAGVAHLDLAHRGNIMVTPDQQPVLIDFQAALSLKYLPKRLVKLCIRTDELAILKWKQRQRPDLLSDEDRRNIKKRNQLTRLWPFHHWIFWPGSRKPKQRKN